MALVHGISHWYQYTHEVLLGIWDIAIQKTRARTIISESVRLWFMCMSLILIDIYKSMKFHVDILLHFWDINMKSFVKDRLTELQINGQSQFYIPPPLEGDNTKQNNFFNKCHKNKFSTFPNEFHSMNTVIPSSAFTLPLLGKVSWAPQKGSVQIQA